MPQHDGPAVSSRQHVYSLVSGSALFASGTTHRHCSEAGMLAPLFGFLMFSQMEGWYKKKASSHAMSLETLHWPVIVLS